MGLRKRKIDAGNWFWASNEIFNTWFEGLKKPKPANIRLVYLYLARCADNNAICWPTEEDISKKTGICLRVVVDAISILAKGRFIEVEKIKIGKNKKNRYSLSPPSEWRRALNAPNRVHSMHIKKNQEKNKKILEIRKELATKLKVYH